MAGCLMTFLAVPRRGADWLARFSDTVAFGPPLQAVVSLFHQRTGCRTVRPESVSVGGIKLSAAELHALVARDGGRRRQVGGDKRPAE